jgi:dihydroorotate dehydrogenase
MHKFYSHKIDKQISINFKPRTLWGIKFNLPLLNAAGMFKNGEGYNLVAKQGAGGYIGGTSTYNPRIGNIKLNIKHPFVSLPEAHTSLNFLGLPNCGDEYLSKQIITTEKLLGCPLGWSVMRSPDYAIDVAIDNLLKSLWLYHDNPEIDFIEINESCPNIQYLTSDKPLDVLKNRLEYIAHNFLSQRKRHLPVIVKFSNDITINQIPQLVNMILECKFDGINLGNTSTDYTNKNIVNNGELKLYNYFTQNIGGGIGGRLLKQNSLYLCDKVITYLSKNKPDYEFHIIRTGGIDTLQDILDSDNAGVSLNQWYTGYFDNYIKYGDNLYAQIFNPVI